MPDEVRVDAPSSIESQRLATGPTDEIKVKCDVHGPYGLYRLQLLKKKIELIDGELVHTGYNLLGESDTWEGNPPGDSSETSTGERLTVVGIIPKNPANDVWAQDGHYHPLYTRVKFVEVNDPTSSTAQEDILDQPFNVQIDLEDPNDPPGVPPVIN